MRHRDPNFLEWFGRSIVSDKFGNPLVVFRGEHGPIELAPATGDQNQKWGAFQTRLGALSFGSAMAASVYAMNPNWQDDWPFSPRVTAAHLSIQKPVMNRPHDPFVELEDIARAVGKAVTREIALAMKDHITHTNRWCDDIGQNFENFDDYFYSSVFKFEDIYFDAYALFDDTRYVSIFRAAGFDGASHGGSGGTFGEVEYKVFSVDQVWPLTNAKALYEKLAR
jgi:hypothetical protein